ncbi:hypothetical protein QP157_10255 [Sphingomonas sp. LR61]|uniref:hypothetical protein n=1 Tax=Sphingomonas sp. LR61 TaxID=3050234 RepID=UPI002FE1EA53
MVWSTASCQARSGSLPPASTFVISVANAPMNRSELEMYVTGTSIAEALKNASGSWSPK